MDSYYEYHNNPPQGTDDTAFPGECGLPWLWIHKTPEGVLEPTEIGNMAYSWLQFALYFLEEESARPVGERSFTQTEEDLLSEGAELLLGGGVEPEDQSVGLDGCCFFEVVDHEDLPCYRKIVGQPDPGQ